MLTAANVNFPSLRMHGLSVRSSPRTCGTILLLFFGSIIILPVNQSGRCGLAIRFLTRGSCWSRLVISLSELQREATSLGHGSCYEAIIANK